MVDGGVVCLFSVHEAEFWEEGMVVHDCSILRFGLMDAQATWLLVEWKS